jgi:hypothetical protein
MVRPRPPIRAATAVPVGYSPEGQEMTIPTHSMPIIGIDSAHSPRRMCISAWLRPKALTWIKAVPAVGMGMGWSSMERVEGGPNELSRIAFIVFDVGIMSDVIRQVEFGIRFEDVKI